MESTKVKVQVAAEVQGHRKPDETLEDAVNRLVVQAEQKGNEGEARLHLSLIDPKLDLIKVVTLAEIVQCICDPGARVSRGDNYQEPVPNWSGRAVLHLLEERKLL